MMGGFQGEKRHYWYRCCDVSSSGGNHICWSCGLPTQPILNLKLEDYHPFRKFQRSGEGVYLSKGTEPVPPWRF